ncbi:unnamed protein product [Periconia digitata]|uniref:Nonribosomal peptide synthetase 12 n=1 Tax=Periconia digitata TaxID=1303443 RepID=A0A9W4XXH8_9PLEO|nr:unnamed protein product [Periconia digitata]
MSNTRWQEDESLDTLSRQNDSKELYNPTASTSTLVESKMDIKATEMVLSSSSSVDSSSEEKTALPQKKGIGSTRWLRHKAFILYRKFFSVIVLINVALACYILWAWQRYSQNRFVIANIATAAASNLTATVLVRSEPVINAIFAVFCSVPTSWPLAIRRRCARVFHIGGIHSGCAIATMLWFTVFTVIVSLELTKPSDVRANLELNNSSDVRAISLATAVLTYFIWPILFTICATSHPQFRHKHHDIWEMTHRFGGWTALALLWAQSFVAAKDLALETPLHLAFAQSPSIWLLSITTAAIIFPWLHLRRVPVLRSEFLSSHAVRLWFDYTTPVVGTTVRLAFQPLRDWHGFATITNANNQSGYSLIVSNVGDFTKRAIHTGPEYIYIRGIPTCGVLCITPLFKSVVLVATGSGIGPCLAIILAKRVPYRIMWVAPNPEVTFGKELVKSVLDHDPHAIIHNTRTQGKPDMSLMAWKLYKESGAEAVCVISNKMLTQQVVYGLESRGIPAYGAIFDS